jgi:hypothetical protein
MSKFDNIAETIGNSPVVRSNRLAPRTLIAGMGIPIERYNPSRREHACTL